MAETQPFIVDEQFVALTAAELSDVQTRGQQLIAEHAEAEVAEAAKAVPFGEFEDATEKHAEMIHLGRRGILKLVDSGTGEENHEREDWLAASEGAAGSNDHKQLM